MVGKIILVSLIVLTTATCQLMRSGKDSSDTSSPSPSVGPTKDRRTKPMQQAVLLYKGLRFNSLSPIRIYGKKKIMLEAEFDQESENNQLFISREGGDYRKEASFSHMSSFAFLLDTGKSPVTHFTLRAVSHKGSQEFPTEFQVIVSSFKEISSLSDIKETAVYLDGKEVTTPEITLYQQSVMLKIVFDDTPLQKLTVKQASDGSISTSDIQYGSALHLARLLTGQDQEAFTFTIESGNDQFVKKKTFILHLDDPHILTTKATIDPKTVTLSCPGFGEDCPTGTGVLYTVHKLGTGFCTSSYLGNKTFVTNGHCVPRELLGQKNVPCTGFMSLVLPEGLEGIPGQKVFACDKILDSALQPDSDYALYTTFADPGVEALKKGNPTSESLHTWSAYNPSGDFKTITLKKSTCSLIRENFDYFPLKNSLNTLIHYGKPPHECMLAPGTSGSTMLDELGQWVALHFSGFTSHTKQSGLNATDFGLSSIHNLKTGIHTSCVPDPPNPVPEHCKGWLSETNKRVSRVFQELPSGPKLAEKIASLEEEFERSAITSDFFNEYNFTRILYAYNKSRPQWHLAMPSPDCIDPNTIFYAPVCFLRVVFNEALNPESFETDRCENKIGFTLNGDNQIMFSEDQEIFASYPHSIKSCEG